MSAEAVAEFRKLGERLESLFQAGQGNGAEADALRDQMEAPWSQMTPGERREFLGDSERQPCRPSDSPATGSKCGNYCTGY